ncbi:tetratricopeptide repeat protein [Undibacterium aquatile]|uniref:Tetratricopeptide repeat protein n=1 Tax=Undibacterium aquatile TaxID=1537398 RepID=A0ABR6XHC8_9BURK|nr:hypothetical protein [Undibacterium aquatile]MBC3812313.1 hypothetical protein [Undibacterium aquatile]
MKKIFIFFLLLMNIQTQTIAVEKEKSAQLKVAQELFNDATNDKSPTLIEMDEVLKKISGISPKAGISIERQLSLLKIQVFQYKYSLIESPQFKDNKGGRMFLLQAKKIAEDWLARYPNDVDFLIQLQLLQVTLREPSGATIKKLIEIDPNNGSYHLLLYLDYFYNREFDHALEELVKAIKVETNILRKIEYMEKGLSLAHDAECSFENDLIKKLEKVHHLLRSNQSAPPENSVDYRRLVNEFKKVEIDYINMLDIQNCASLAPRTFPSNSH